MAWQMFLFLAALVSQTKEGPLGTKVAALVKQLGSSSEADRKNAVEGLVALGPNALADLPGLADPSLSADQKKLLTEVTKKLWRTRLEMDVQGSWVELPAKTMPLLDLLGEIEKQTGNPIRDQREDFNEAAENPSIAWDGKKRRFWEAMDEICRLANVRMENFAGENVIGIRSSTADVRESALAATFGAIRIVPISITLSRQWNAPAGRATVSLQAVFEPKLRPLLVEIDLNEYKILDDKDRSIGLNEEQSQTSFSFQIEEGAHHFDIALDLASPPRDASKIKLIEGSAVMQLPASNERFVFDDWTK